MAIKTKPIRRQRITMTIRGTSPMVQHQWSEKAKKQIRDKKLGRKSKDREILDADAEFKAACYLTADGRHGVPVMAIKSAIIGAAHKDLGIEKTMVRRSLFFPCDDPGMIVPMTCSDPVMREDYVRVGVSGTDLRYRPEFRHWAVEIVMEIDAENLTLEDLANLVNRAGFGVGIGEMRPEKGGEYGRFEVDASVPLHATDL